MADTSKTPQIIGDSPPEALVGRGRKSPLKPEVICNVPVQEQRA